MTDQGTALDGRVDDIDLTDPARTPAPERAAGPAGSDPAGGFEAGGFEAGGDEADGARGRGQVAAMTAGAIALAVGVLFGMRWARQRRRDMTVVIVDEPEAARWRRLVRRSDVTTAT